MNSSGNWYFTAPWDPIPVRRGDALGLRAGADYFADLLAPGLSNATSDARWISLLSWCLKWSHLVWTNADGGDLSQRDGQRARYAWLRPLELLWVDRTLESGQKTGQLRGRRSIARWREGDRKSPNFAMSQDQFRRYRQVGTYGAYRVVLRNVEGLTTGDGWTPGKTAHDLANIVNDSLPRGSRLTQQHFEQGTQWRRWSEGGHARYWVEHGWPMSSAEVGGLLPTPDDAVGERLPDDERRLLTPALFGAGSVRAITVGILANAKGARTHGDLCDALAGSHELAQHLHPGSITSLPHFSRFADTAMHAMRGLWNRINQDKAQQAPSMEKLAQSADLQARFDLLRAASTGWLRAPRGHGFPHGHDQVATRLAQAMQDAANPLDRLRALAQHHHEHGGGRRWFREQAGRLVPLVADTGIAASDYRFRLRSLSHLAAQCGVANLDVALAAVDRSEFDSQDGHEPDDEDGDAP
jgi:hypothetical protein